MTNQEKAAYLNKYRKAVNDIKIASEELQTWREMATRISPQYSGMPHGSDGSDKLQTAVLEIAELSESIEQHIREAKKLRAQVQQVIDGVEDNTLHTLLTYRYIQGKKWEEINEAIELAIESIRLRIPTKVIPEKWNPNTCP